jgi:hypothetical protein
MQSPIYFLSAILSVCALYLVWSFGIRKFLLDFTRENLFELRFELFRLAMNGEIDFDNEAYRALETLFNGLLRYGHRLSFLTYLVSAVSNSRAQKAKDYVSVSALISLKVSRLAPETQQKVLRILTEAHTMVMGYMGASSLLVLFLLGVLKTLEALGVVHLENEKKAAREVIEREAYFAETRRNGLNLAPA